MMDVGGIAGQEHAAYPEPLRQADVDPVQGRPTQVGQAYVGAAGTLVEVLHRR